MSRATGAATNTSAGAALPHRSPSSRASEANAGPATATDPTDLVAEGLRGQDEVGTVEDGRQRLGERGADVVAVVRTELTAGLDPDRERALVEGWVDG